MDNYKLNVDAYLARIGYCGSLTVSEDTLVKLTRAHLEAVPFENLLIRYEHKEPSLEIADLYTKVVENKRGGYCFELNKIFYFLLKELGFSCYPVPARIVLRREELRPVSHRATIVVIDGRKWFVDVGYGGAGPKGALRMDTTEIQRIYGDDFYIVYDQPDYKGEYALFRVDDGVASRVMVYQDKEWMEVDYTTFNSHFASYDRSPFKNRRVLYRCTPNGWISLTDFTFTTSENGNVQIVELQTEQEVKEVIEQQFELFVTPID